MEANSRPQSVDSVNLGSTYSGFYPTTVPSRSNLAPQQPQLAQQPQQLHHHNNIPQQQPQFQQQYPTHHNNYPISYPNQNQQQQHYPITPQQYPYSSSNNLVPGTNVAQAAAGAAGSQQAQQPPLNHHYNISAYAAAAVAFSNNLKHNQQQQQPMVSGSGSGSAQNRQTFQPIDPAQQQQQLYNNNHQIQQWNQQSQQHQNQQFVPTASVGLPPNLSQGPAPVPGSSTNDYYTEYYSQYYREYYRRLLAYHQQQQQQQPVRQKTPLKYGSRLVHARAVFSTHDNRLLVVEPNSRIALYGLQEIFTEQCYPHLFLQSLLLHVPGDLDSSVVGGTGNSNGSGTTLLPFNDCQVALDWIRIKLLNDTGINYELKLILKVITMLYRQNGVISGLDLSELLYELVSSSNPEPVNLDINTAASEKMSQISGSESAVVTPFGNKDQLLQHLRQLLMRGQRRVAITYAQNNGLFDHAIALAYLSSYQTGSGGGSGTPALHSADNGLMISTIRKFISTTLATSDPLYVFYSHLLQLVANVVSTTTSGVHNNSVSADTTATKSTVQKSNAKIDSLESFIILLANDIEFDKVEITNNSLRHLIDLMIALLMYVFYSHLLQLVANVVSSTTSGVHNNSSSADTTATKSTVQKSNAKIDSLESFIILLANDIEFDKVEITNNSLRHLIDLMIALLKDRFDYVLNDELFHDRFDCLLVNECLEYARFKGGQHNPKLLLRKLEFAFELFDYGFSEHALNYANQIRNKLEEDRKQMSKTGGLFKQLQDSSSLYSNFLLPASCSSLEPDSEDLSKSSSPNDDFVHDIWLYQLLKLTNRFQQKQQKQSDLNRPFITELFKLSTKDGADLENADDNEEEDQDQEDDEDNEVEDDEDDDNEDDVTEADSETINNNNNNNNLNDESSDSIQSSLESTPVKQQQRRLPETSAKFEQQLNSNTESNNLSIVKNTSFSSGQQQHPVNSTFSNQQQQQQFQSNNNLSQQNNESLLSRNELQFQQQNQGMKTMTLRESKIGNSEQFSEQNNSEITDSSNLNFPPPPPPQQQQQHQPQQTGNSASMMMMSSSNGQQQQQQLAPSTFNNSSSNHIPKYQQQFNNSTRTNLHHHHNLNSISENMENQSQPQQPQQQQSQGDNILKKQDEQQQDSRTAVFSSAFDFNNVQPQSQQFPNMSNYLPPNVVHTENNDNSGFIPNFSNIPNGNVGGGGGGGDSMLNQVDSSSSLVQQQPKLFQPPPPPPPPTNMLDSTLDAPPTSTFNFLSPGGHVESIPLYDPISKLMDNKADNQGGQQSSVPSSAADSHRNNQFLQSDNKSNSNNNNDSSSTAKDSTKNSSPSKNNGGLFNVLFSRLRSKNQAILPDDRDPTIVYDEEKKRWIDKSSASGDQNDGQLPPPPKIPIAGPAAATFSNSIPPNFSSTTSSTSEPNSALQSPIMGNLPSLPTFHSLSPAGLTSSIVPGSIPNGGVPVAHSTPPAAASSGLPTRSMSFRKPNRYIDVFNAPNNNSNAAAKKQ